MQPPILRGCCTKRPGQSNIWQILFLLSSLLLLSNLFGFYTTLKQPSCSPLVKSTLPSLKIRPSIGTIFDKPTDSVNKARAERPINCSNLNDSLVKYICEVEATTVFYSPNPQPLVVAKDISTVRYYAQRDLQGWTLAFKNQSFDVVELSYRSSMKLSDLSVFLCLGIHTQDKHCVKAAAYKTLTQGQRINQLHMLRDVLWRKDAFCYTMKEALNNYKGWNNFTFPCWVLPQDKAELQQAMRERKGDWIVKPSFKGEGHGIYVVSSFAELPPILEGLIVQPFLNNPFLVKGKKFDFRTYVLVTSISPPRVYIYKEGLVRFASSRYDKNATRGGKQQQFLTNTSVGKKYTQLANLTWTYQKLRKYMTRKGIDAQKVFDSIDNAIVRTVLASEYRFILDSKYSLGGYDCAHCYQLLGVDVILDDDLHPIVIEVNGLPSMQLSHELGVPPNPSSVYTATKFGLMHDLLQILFNNRSVAVELAMDLRQLNIGVGPGPLCSLDNLYCIDYKTLQKLITSKREYLVKGGYRRLYPSPIGDKYSRFIRHMSHLIKRKLEKGEEARTLWHVHHLYTALEKLYSE